MRRKDAAPSPPFIVLLRRRSVAPVVAKRLFFGFPDSVDVIRFDKAHIQALAAWEQRAAFSSIHHIRLKAIVSPFTSANSISR